VLSFQAFAFKRNSGYSTAVTAEMAEAQLAAAGVLRRMTVRSDWAAAVAAAEGARLLMPLMNAKNDQTRWGAVHVELSDDPYSLKVPGFNP
jgi:hypothetical protein